MIKVSIIIIIIIIIGFYGFYSVTGIGRMKYGSVK